MGSIQVNKENITMLQDKIRKYLASIYNGKLVIVNQDWIPMQFNVNKKYDINNITNRNYYSESIDNKGIKGCLKFIIEELKEIQFGSLMITIKNGAIIEIEKDEKLRLK